MSAGPGLAGATKEMAMNAPAPRPTPAQLELAKSIFTGAAAAAIAQRGANVDFQTMAESSFKAAAAYVAALQEARPPFNPVGAR